MKVGVEELVGVDGELDGDMEFVCVAKVPDVGTAGVATVARVVLVELWGMYVGELVEVVESLVLGFLRASSVGRSLSAKISTILPAAPSALMTFPKSP